MVHCSAVRGFIDRKCTFANYYSSTFFPRSSSSSSSSSLSLQLQCNRPTPCIRFFTKHLIYTCMYVYIYIYIYIYFYTYIFTNRKRSDDGIHSRVAREHRALPHIKSRERLDRALLLFCFLSNNKMSLSYALRATYATEKSRISYFYL